MKTSTFFSIRELSSRVTKSFKPRVAKTRSRLTECVTRSLYRPFSSSFRRRRKQLNRVFQFCSLLRFYSFFEERERERERQERRSCVFQLRWDLRRAKTCVLRYFSVLSVIHFLQVLSLFIEWQNRLWRIWRWASLAIIEACFVRKYS